ncbi:RNA-directed DNA polymerase [Rhodovulum sulfidophilum]|uniref:RNA-directed DNA polymerase n=1 Tax=Rhodovulum sulfidophilum TaxID=35806 RepID=UPI001389CA78|nr:RNA-directed DNA polymerase [Rhodovulum sulfidophilum]NDK36784.1 RNA-directed DNA polymerase [Rhodovulum sulfidophilum]
MKRSRAGIADVADWRNLMAAFGRAALGKRGRADVEAYRCNLDAELTALREGLLRGDYPVGQMRRFTIRDPKPRVIHAPCFRERVLHHALIAQMGPRMDLALVNDVYACRVGKGSHEAVKRVQHHARRWPYYAQIDIRQYFPSVDHRVLLHLIDRKFSDHDLLALVRDILAAHQDAPGKGLPIGALTSQNFANLYLADADRRVTQHPASRGYARYMDDLIWWGETRTDVRAVLADLRPLVEAMLKLEIKRPVRIGRSRDGVSFCGYRVFADRLLLSRRRKARFAEARREAEAAFARGDLSAGDLQSRMDAALAITAGAEATAWRRAQLARVPLAPMVVEA